MTQEGDKLRGQLIRRIIDMNVVRVVNDDSFTCCCIAKDRRELKSSRIRDLG